MKLLLINYEYPPIGGGAATASQAIARNLIRLGHDVTVLTARFRNLPAIADENGVIVRRVPCLRRYPDRCRIFEMTSFILSASFFLPFLIWSRRPGGVIAFFSIPCGPIALLTKALFHLPFVISLRGGDVPGLVPEIKGTHRWLRPIRRAALEHAIAVVANAQGLRALSEAQDPASVQVIPNGVDADYFRPAPQLERTNGDGVFRIVFTGRFHSQKNVGLLLEQCAELRAATSSRFELHLIGDGPLRGRLQRQVQQLGLSDVVTFHGWQPPDELRKMYQRSHCFVNPSSYEGMPNAVLEAMACALPVVASDIPGNDVVVRHGLTGILFPLERPDSLAESLADLIANRELARQMGEAGRSDATENFSWHRVAQQYAELFAA